MYVYVFYDKSIRINLPLDYHQLSPFVYHFVVNNIIIILNWTDAISFIYALIKIFFLKNRQLNSCIYSTQHIMEIFHVDLGYIKILIRRKEKRKKTARLHRRNGPMK